MGHHLSRPWCAILACLGAPPEQAGLGHRHDLRKAMGHHLSRPQGTTLGGIGAFRWAGIGESRNLQSQTCLPVKCVLRQPMFPSSSPI
eukprot:1143327-Pelagomonas_calceolata.AAC.8